MAGRQFHLAVARISFGAAPLKVAAAFFFLFRKEFFLPCGDIAAVYKYEAFVFSRGVLIRHAELAALSPVLDERIRSDLRTVRRTRDPGRIKGRRAFYGSRCFLSGERVQTPSLTAPGLEKRSPQKRQKTLPEEVHVDKTCRLFEE